jgi:hypothetical protein
MRARLVVLLLSAILVFYLAVVGLRALVLIGDGRPAFVLLGVGVLALPVLGAWILVQELRFGRATQRLAEDLDGPFDLPGPATEGRPATRAGRRARADEAFRSGRDAVAAAPEDWRAWYRLALAYADSGDRTAARRTMRRAIGLHDRPR